MGHKKELKNLSLWKKTPFYPGQQQFTRVNLSKRVLIVLPARTERMASQETNKIFMVNPVNPKPYFLCFNLFRRVFPNPLIANYFNKTLS